MVNAPYAWDLKCAWCEYAITVNPRGGRGRDQGAGFAAAATMQQLRTDAHHRGRSSSDASDVRSWSGGQERRRQRGMSRATNCPIPCDDDCEAECHLWHEPTWKRDPGHQHANGDPRIDAFVEGTRLYARTQMADWSRMPDDQVAAGLDFADRLLPSRA